MEAIRRLQPVSRDYRNKFRYASRQDSVLGRLFIYFRLIVFYKKQAKNKMESIEKEVLESFNVSQLKDELKTRYLSTGGLKVDLVERLRKDNLAKVEQGIMDEFKKEKNRRMSEQMELKNLKLEIEMMKQKENDEEMQAGMSKSDSTSHYDPVLLHILQTQSELLTKMANLSNSNCGIQVFSTSDTSQAIPLFGGNRKDNVHDWVKQVERVSALANWSENLTLVNASMRLRGPAGDWHKAYGKKIYKWEDYKNKLIERFSNKMTFAEFICYQSKRVLRATETITEYIYGKNAMFERCPTVISDADKVSLILEGIVDHRWSIPLATHCCTDVEDLLTHATALDNIRKIHFKDKYTKNTENVSRDTKSSFNWSDSKRNTFIPKYNPATDKEEEQTCFRCKNKGHISYNCTVEPKESTSSSNTLQSTQLKHKVTSKSHVTNNNNKIERKHVSCIQNESPNVTLIPVTVNNNIQLTALPDSGSVLTIIDKSYLPNDTQLYAWQKGDYKVAGSNFTPIGWFSSRLQIGKIDYVMPQIAVCENLPVPMILGKDWQFAVYARIIHEPDGKVCIITPTHTEYFPSNCKEIDSIACCVQVKSIVKEDQDKVMKLVSEFDDIFKNDCNDIGKFTDFEMEIKLKNNKPISCKPYRLPEPERKFLKDTVEKWLEQKICRLSSSPYAAPMFVVQQLLHESSPYRPVVDYSKTINPITILDAQPIERMEDIILTVSQFVYKFKLDIYHAYHNICIKEEDIYKTAVITQDYHIEFMRVMFGLVGGPAIMSKVIKTTYGNLYNQGVRAYFDDITGGSNNIENLLYILRKVFELTREKCLKLNREKCIFIASEIPLFGKLVGFKQERTDPKRIAAVEQYKTLSTLTEIRSFLGFVGSFRKYIKNFACIAKPLQELLKKNKKEDIESQRSQKKKRINLSVEQQKSFETLRNSLITAPVLANFQQEAETIVETDSSYQGLGACLVQIQNGERKVIEYASRCLKDAELRYHINELEVTAVHWAIVSKFRIYLLGHKFTLITDSYSTAYIIDRAKINRKFARYVVDLASFDFTPVHRPGKQNVIADHLSRYPLEDMCMLVISSNLDKLKLAQKKDPFTQQIINKLSKESSSQHIKQMKESYEISEGILLHVSNQELFNQKKIVIPQSLRENVIRIAHNDNGHLDYNTTLNKIKSKYWWKTIRQDVKAYVAACLVCAKTNRRTKFAYGQMGQRPIPETPMQVISSDHIIALPETQSGYTYIFVHIDHATRYIFAKPTYSLSAQNVIDTIENDIIYVYGPPLTYISDSAPCFTSQKTQNFFSKFGIEHIPTTPYTAQSNGLVERANATIVATLTKFAMENKDDWDRLLPKAILAINISKQKTTGYSPFYLMFGYEPRIPPNEIHFGTIFEDFNRENQLDLLSHARGTALSNIISIHLSNKKKFDMRRLEYEFKPDDYVVYEWYKPTDTKLTSRYKGPFKIIRKIGSVCYEIQDIQKPTVKKIVHVQYIKPLHSLPDLHSFSAFSDDNTQNNDESFTHIIQRNQLEEQSDSVKIQDKSSNENNTIDSGKQYKQQYITTKGRKTYVPISYKL